jgi:hypothetical protein
MEEIMKPKIFFVVCLVSLLGWFGAQGVKAQDHTSIMQDSRFQQWNIDTPQEKTFFNQFPQGKVITYTKGDKVVHVHKDPQTGVVCYGDDTALQGYMQKCQDTGITPRPRGDAAQQDDPMFWNMWASERGLG